MPIIWYMILVAIGAALIIFTLINKGSILDLFGFLLAISSLAYLLEVVVLFVLRSYDYKPGLYADSIAESIFGHLICNGIFWGGFMLLTAAFQLKFKWIVLFSGFFMLVELLFLRLDLYVHYWWHIYYTGAGVILLLSLCKAWLPHLLHAHSTGLRTITFYLIAWILLTGPTIILLITGGQRFHSGLSANIYLDDIFLDVPYHLALSGMVVLTLNQRWRFLRTPIPFLMTAVFDGVLYESHRLTFSEPWNFFLLESVRFLCLMLYLMLHKHAFKQRPLSSAPAGAS